MLFPFTFFLVSCILSISFYLKGEASYHFFLSKLFFFLPFPGLLVTTLCAGPAGIIYMLILVHCQIITYTGCLQANNIALYLKEKQKTKKLKHIKFSGMQLHVMPVHHKIKNIYFSFLFLCFLLFLLFWCELLCRVIIIRNVHLLSNIIELDGTLLVPLKQPKLHLNQPSTLQTRIRQGLSIYLYIAH